MATPLTRLRTLGLYRRILRTARTWKDSPGAPGPAEEKAYIAREARTLFRKYRELESAEEIEKQLFDGEARLEYAIHYKIPYPRPVNLPTGTTIAGLRDRANPYTEVPSSEMASLDQDGDEEVIGLRQRRRVAARARA